MLSIRHHVSYSGPNVWTRVPVVYAVVDSGAITPSLESIPDLHDRYAALTELVHENAALEPSTGVVKGDLGAAIARAALDLQRTAGIPVGYSDGHARADGGFDVVVEQEQAAVGFFAITVAVHWFAQLLDPWRSGFELANEFARFVAFNETVDHGVMGRAIRNAAARRGIPRSVIDPSGRVLELGTGRYRQRIVGQSTTRTGAIAAYVADDKHLTNCYLRDAGLPVPESRMVRTPAQALAAAAEIGYPVVLKPNHLKDNYGVELDLRDDEELRAAFVRVSEVVASPRPRMVVERFVAGNDYRAMVVNGVVAGVSRRLRPEVRGDGVRTIRELVELENANPRRSSRRNSVYKPIPIDDRMHDELERQGLTLDDIPATGQEVVLNQSGHRRDGAIQIDVTDVVHPENAGLLGLAARVIGLDFAGIDVVTPDIGEPMRETGGVIIELNENPAFNLHLVPGAGEARDPGPAIIDMLFPPGQPVRIPVVAMMATEDSGAVCAAIAQAFADGGQVVGVATRDGVTIGGTRYTGVEGRNPHGPRTVLNNPLVEVAVVEIDAASIVEHGLGCDVCDVAIIQSLSGLLRPDGRPVETVLLDAFNGAGIVLLHDGDPAVAALGRGEREVVTIGGGLAGLPEPVMARVLQACSTGSGEVRA